MSICLNLYGKRILKVIRIGLRLENPFSHLPYLIELFYGQCCYFNRRWQSPQHRGTLEDRCERLLKSPMSSMSYIGYKISRHLSTVPAPAIFLRP